MKKLEDFGVLEMNSKELKKTEGGIFLLFAPYIVIAPFAAVFALGAYNGYHSA